MQKTVLSKKGRWRTALLVLALSVVGMGKGYAQKYQVNYDFSAVCETGQTLWYKIIDEAHRYVAVVAPSIKYNEWFDFWVCFERPVGDLVIPEQVQGYTVVGLYESHTNNKTSGTFQGCTGLTSVVIPNTVQSIQQSAFAHCSSLVSITIPESIPYIESGSFSGCTSLNSVLYKGSIAQWCGFTFSDKSRNPLYYAHNLYVDNTLITDLVIPDGVTSVGNYAFSGCFMTSITIPNSVTTIENGAFSGCMGLTSITFGNSISKIGGLAFSDCTELTSITIPVSVDTIGGAAFGGCSRLTTVYYNAENAVASTNVFCSYQNENWVNSCPNLTTIHIGADVQEIGDNVFKGCDGVHLVVAMGPTPATLVGGAFTDFADNSILMVSCGKRMTYFSVWNMFEFNNIMEDCNTYPVSMGNVGAGGSISASTTNAQMGEVVDLTVSPNAGMMLSSISVFNASDPTQTIPVMPVGKATSMYRFVMPPFGVSVTATFVAGTSVGENGSVPASVYPNPTNGQIKIEAEGLKHFSVSNMLGQTVYQGKACGSELVYDLGRHGAGLYLIRIETTEGVATKRVAVMR